MSPKKLSVNVAGLSAPWTPATLRFQAWKGMMPARKRPGESARRALNISTAMLLIILLAPLMLLIALLVRLTSRGPVIYIQARVGLDRRMDRGVGPLNPHRKRNSGGRIFMIYKFRTMRSDADSDGQTWAAAGDPRITLVGRFLRACHLDELPQLFNVLKGDMNIVGPRPEQTGIFEGLGSALDQYRLRQRVLPGITGLAQVMLPYDATLSDVRRKVDLDLHYIRHRCSSGDLGIMAKTLPVIVMRKGR
jgi:lipopolysaccharide/colanic/teichoic acid biosynthesis glycosyltransferase